MEFKTLLNMARELEAALTKNREAVDAAGPIEVGELLLDAEVDAARIVATLETLLHGDIQPIGPTIHDMTIEEARDELATFGRDISVVRLRQLCGAGRVPGATKFGRQWRINRYALPMIARDVREPGRPTTSSGDNNES